MIAHQWNDTGVSRMHLGILGGRQFEISEQGRLRSLQGQPQLWLLDDFRGSWIGPDPQAWLARTRDCVASVLAGNALQRYAVVLPTAMIEALSCMPGIPAGAAAGVIRLFYCAVEARRWACAVTVPRSHSSHCREAWRRPRFPLAISAALGVRAA